MSTQTQENQSPKGRYQPTLRTKIPLLITLILLNTKKTLAQFIGYDERCNITYPLRCQSNDTCYLRGTQCAISSMCSTPGLAYQCPENECQDRFFNCKTKKLDCRFRSHRRCPDGFCRTDDCKKVHYSCCPMNKPLLCGSGRCVSYMFQCSGGSYCPLHTPFICSDMSCTTSLELCPDTKKGGTFPPQVITYDFTNKHIDHMTSIFKGSQVSKKTPSSLMITVKIFYDAFNAPKGSPFYNKTLNRSAKMVIEPYGLDRLQNLTNELNSTLAEVSRNFFMIAEFNLPYFVTIRSAAIKVSTKGRFDDNAPFKVPFIVQFAIDTIKKHEIAISNYEDYLCLAKVIHYDNRWECVSRNILNLEYTNDMRLLLSNAAYNVPGPGIYAVIFRPRMTPGLITDQFCGLVCKNRRLVIFICFVILPILMIIACMCWKYVLLKWESEEREAEAIQRREKLIQMEKLTAGFKGQSLKEKMAENMQYHQNPLQGKSEKELDDVNKLNNMIERMERDIMEINDVKKDLLAKTKRQIQKITVIRDNIENLGTNRFDQEIGIDYNPKGNYTN